MYAFQEKKSGVFVVFPGDEEQFGGCLAAGRGFVHVGPDGSLEPCPFAPYSDVSLKTTPLREALGSKLLCGDPRQPRQAERDPGRLRALGRARMGQVVAGGPRGVGRHGGGLRDFPRAAGRSARVHPRRPGLRRQEFLGSHVVVVRDGLVERLLPAAAPVPVGAEFIDARDQTVLPGFTDASIRFAAPPRRFTESPERYGPGRMTAEAMSFFPRNRRQLLADGVTAIADAGAPVSFYARLRKALVQRSMAGPDLRFAGPEITAPMWR